MNQHLSGLKVNMVTTSTTAHSMPCTGGCDGMRPLQVQTDVNNCTDLFTINTCTYSNISTSGISHKFCILFKLPSYFTLCFTADAI
jgi:hypothetical protein